MIYHGRELAYVVHIGIYIFHSISMRGTLSHLTSSLNLESLSKYWMGPGSRDCNPPLQSGNLLVNIFLRFPSTLSNPIAFEKAGLLNLLGTSHKRLVHSLFDGITIFLLCLLSVSEQIRMNYLSLSVIMHVIYSALQLIIPPNVSVFLSPRRRLSPSWIESPTRTLTSKSSGASVLHIWLAECFRGTAMI